MKVPLWWNELMSIVGEDALLPRLEVVHHPRAVRKRECAAQIPGSGAAEAGQQ